MRLAPALVLLATPAHAATARVEDGGVLADGRRVAAIVLTNDRGVSARILAYGAILQSLIVPDRHGHRADIVLGHDSAGEYEAHQDYLGATVGRYANRLAGAEFTLDGQTYHLRRNGAGPNSVHGGGMGFDRQVFNVDALRGGKSAMVRLSHTSPDGDSGYPGELRVGVTYRLDNAGALTITFDAATTKPTIVNITNHALFNLRGEGRGAATTATLTIPASRMVPIAKGNLPTGAMRDVAHTPFDFRAPRPIDPALRDGRDPQITLARGIDHSFMLDQGRTRRPHLAARLNDRASGRWLEMLTTEPSVQIYTGNYFDGSKAGKTGHLYRMGDGIALEPGLPPDTPHHPEFGDARVDPGKPYRHIMVYRVGWRAGGMLRKN